MNLYLTFKALHIIAVISWMAGLLYLPRIFVYHSDISEKKESMDTFKIMERKLFWAIMTPSALATIILGAWLLAANWNYFMASRWMQLKLGFVALLLLQHLYCYWFMIKLRSNAAYKPHAFFRVFNELPVIPLVVIVILVVVKPTI